MQISETTTKKTSKIKLDFKDSKYATGKKENFNS